MPAASLTIAAAQASQNVQLVAQTGGGALLKTQLTAWLNAIAKALPDPSSMSKRTVLNWIPRGNEIAAGIDTLIAAPQSQDIANTVALYVWQSSTAAAAAQIAGRISNAEAASILASYNVIFP